MHQSLTIARLVDPALSTIGIDMLASQAAYHEMAALFLGGLCVRLLFRSPDAGRWPRHRPARARSLITLNGYVA